MLENVTLKTNLRNRLAPFLKWIYWKKTGRSRYLWCQLTHEFNPRVGTESLTILWMEKNILHRKEDREPMNTEINNLSTGALLFFPLYVAELIHLPPKKKIGVEPFIQHSGRNWPVVPRAKKHLRSGQAPLLSYDGSYTPMAYPWYIRCIQITCHTRWNPTILCWYTVLFPESTQVNR